MIEDDRYTVGIRDEGTTRMEGSRFNRVQVVIGSLTAKRISRRKNHGIYTVSVIKDKLGIWG